MPEQNNCEQFCGDKCKAYVLSRQGIPGHTGETGNFKNDAITKDYHKKRDKLVNEIYWLDVEYYGKVCKHNKE